MELIEFNYARPKRGIIEKNLPTWEGIHKATWIQSLAFQDRKIKIKFQEKTPGQLFIEQIIGHSFPE